jgi:hypothetical protein
VEARWVRGFMMDTNRHAHLAQLECDIQRWLQEADRLEEEGEKYGANLKRSWAQNAGLLAERIKTLPQN